jgi:hypothetical protein
MFAAIKSVGTGIATPGPIETEHFSIRSAACATAAKSFAFSGCFEAGAFCLTLTVIGASAQEEIDALNL